MRQIVTHTSMTIEEIAAEISALLARLQFLITELEINAKNVEELRKGVIEQQEEYSAAIAKLTKLHTEEIARLIEENADIKRGLGDLGQTL